MSLSYINGTQEKTINPCAGASAMKSDDEPLTIEEVLEVKKSFKQRENKLLTELQDAKDQAELLEFRVLELEEEQEKVKIVIISHY